MKHADVLKELATLALNNIEANWAWCAINGGQPPEVALMTVFKHCLVVNGQLRDKLEKYMVRAVPPVVIQYPGTVQEFIKLQNSMKGERNEAYEGTE